MVKCMEKKKETVELLSPAGSFEGFLAALSGGADAIYLAGKQFGARAYADNLDEEELLKAIDIAHLYGRKLYLTVNTLVKSRELEALHAFLSPLYLRGLDGVIVQDIGVVEMIHHSFPRMAVHASTQMCVCGATAANYLKELGVKRVIPARELSLKEIKALKDESGLEVECFIHGSMCYCYSGQCFMSSYLGGRSGNRGRCAGPCRLPYSAYDHDGNKVVDSEYLLSMKDMCGIQYIPELIEAGVDSFKIEGRMKSPEYTYLITSIYRKYIDLYLENGRKGFGIKKEDYNQLVSSYLRKDVQSGYFFKHNGKDMITIEKGGYNGDREDVEIPNIKKTKITGQCRLSLNEPARLTIFAKWKNSTVKIDVTGETCEAAKSSPINADDVAALIKKTGDTPFEFEKLDVVIDGDIFLGVKAVKDLRRKGIAKLQEMLLSGYIRRSNQIEKISEYELNENVEKPYMTALAETSEQLKAIYSRSDRIKRVYVESDLFFSDEFIMPDGNIEIYIAFPYVLRLNSRKMLERVCANAKLDFVQGVLVRNYDSFYLAKKLFEDKKIITDFNLYSYNQIADYTLKSTTNVGTTFPLELNYHEIKERQNASELLIYGHIPMMVSANCIQKTTAECIGEGRHLQYISDRYNVKFPVIENCEYCYNRILNSVPLSLHADLEQIREIMAQSLRLQFSIENYEECVEIIDFYTGLLDGSRGKLPFEEFTRGHFKKSVL